MYNEGFEAFTEDDHCNDRQSNKHGDGNCRFAEPAERMHDVTKTSVKARPSKRKSESEFSTFRKGVKSSKLESKCHV